jgi:hypothetical protein
VNTILMPLWAATMFFLLRSCRTRGTGLAALAGAAVGACVLAKYWSLVLLASGYRSNRFASCRLFPFSRTMYFSAVVALIVIAAHEGAGQDVVIGSG